MARCEIVYAYDSAFEGGYTYSFIVERWLDDELTDLHMDDGKAVLIVPPWGPDGTEDSWGLGMSSDERRAVLELETASVDLDELDTFSPRPGTGLGSFLPPGVMTTEGRFHRMIAIEVAPVPA